MIQVDVFWAFAMGACFSCLAARQIRIEASVVVNSYFMYNICFLGILFAPSGVFLLWEFPAWETMFVFNRELITGSLVAVFASTNVLFGIIGFLVASFFIRRDQVLFANSIWMLGYVIMFGILGFGYKRFTYTGNAKDWVSGKEFPIILFFQSPVFFTLLWMGVAIIPALYYPIITWPKSCGSTYKENRRVFWHLILTSFLGVLFGGLCYAFWLNVFATPSQIIYVTMSDFDFMWKGKLIVFGPYSPLVGYFIAQISFTSLVLFPFLLQTSSKRRKIKKKTK